MSSSKIPNKTAKPLSAYNLFFQYNRIILLASYVEHPFDFSTSDDNVSPPGLEGLDPYSPILSAPEPEIRKYRKQVIEYTINNSPFNDPKKKSNNGSMTFVEMSNYMSKKWKNADETTKSIFRQLSNESKAKHQKLQLDSYKKIAKRFSFTNPSNDTSSFSETPNRVSLGSIASSAKASSYKTRAAGTNTSMSNSTWDEQPNQTKIASPATNVFLYQDSQQSNLISFGSTSSTAHRRSSEGSYQSHAYSRRSSYATAASREDYGDFIPESPVDFEMPLPYHGSNQEMNNCELRSWLNNLDWAQM
ncbi:hypothetical protein ACHAXS_003325 [Conticribra weissflogii]